MTAPAIDVRMGEIERALQGIVRNLRTLAFRFDRPDQVLPGPEAGAEQAIERIENEIGEVPAALKLFWTRIGSVDLSGRHGDWSDAEYPDQLIVYPPSVAIAELDEFLADREERLKADFPYLIPVAPDALHKEDVSGGMWYNIDVPAVADDPPLNDEPHNTTFLEYLEIAARWGGFPGLENDPSHTWPLAAIVGRVS